MQRHVHLVVPVAPAIAAARPGTGGRREQRLVLGIGQLVQVRGGVRGAQTEVGVNMEFM